MIIKVITLQKVNSFRIRINKNQRKILEFLKDKDASKFYSNEEIADETGLSTTTVGSECYKMRKAGVLLYQALSGLGK